jgi:hypothetical protein
MNREISLMEVGPSGRFFVREMPIEPKRVVATMWSQRLLEQPLDLRR